MSGIPKRFEAAHVAIDALGYIWDNGGKGLKALNRLHSNDPINKVGLAMASPLAAISDVAHGKGVGAALKGTYGGLENPNLSNLAGSAFTIGAGMGVVGGLTHDSAGNPDIAGIPFI